MDDKIYVTKPSLPPIEEYIEQIKEIWEEAILTNMGPKHVAFENQLKKYLNVEDVSLFTNGHMALEMTLQAFELSGEIITTPFTFASTVHAIVRNGLTPVFCDINIENFTIDANKIEELITDKTSAILPVHVYGNICDVEKIQQIAKRHNLKVIYDAAHAFGVKLNGRDIGNFGDASMFSFHATKVFHTIEGGAITFSNKDIADKLYNLKNFGIKSPTNVEEVGANAKMNEFQAAMGICNLKYISESINKRERVYNRYLEHLRGISGIKVNEKKDNIISNYSYFPVTFNKEVFGSSRDEIVYELNKEEIYPRRYFYPLCSDFECYKAKYDSNKTPTAQWVSNNILTLPLYADLKLNIVDKICEIILKKK